MTLANRAESRESLLRSLVEGAPNAISEILGRFGGFSSVLQLDEDGSPQDQSYISPDLKRIIGFEDHEFPNSLSAWHDRIPAEDLQRNFEAADHHKSGATAIYETTYRILHRDQSYRWIHSRGSLIRDENGKPLIWGVISFDVTERECQRLMHKAERDILESIALGHDLINILESITVAMERVFPDSENVIYRLNEEETILQLAAAPRLKDEVRQKFMIVPVGEGFCSCGTAAHRGEMVVVPSIAQSDVWPDDQKQMALAFGLGSCCSTPILNDEDRKLGTLAIMHRYPRDMNLQERQHIKSMAHLAALAISRDRANEDIREHQERTNKARAQLQREHEIFDQIMKTSVAAVTVLSPDGRITYTNHAAEKVLGLKPEDATKRSYNSPEWKHTTLDGRPFPDADMPFTRIMNTGEPVFDVRHAIEWPNGERRALSVNGAPVKNDSDEIVSLVFSVRDITEELKTETAFHESEERFSLVTKATRDGIWDTDFATQKTWRNEGYLAWFGQTSNSDPTMNWWASRLHPEDRERVVTSYLAALDSDAEYWSEAYRMIASNDKIIHILARANIHRDENGKPSRVLGAVTDVTNIRRTESAIRCLVKATTDTGPAFFDHLACAMTDALGAHYALVARVDPDAPRTAKVISMVCGGELIEPAEYDLAGTPCEHVLGGDICFYPKNVQQLFPEDILLKEMQAESYLGMPLLDANGKGVGLLAVLHTEPFTESSVPKDILQIFAARAAAELERTRITDVLKESETHYRELADSNRRLLAEVNHRVRNNLAELLALLKLTEQSKRSKSHVVESLRTRIGGMLHTHDLLSEVGWADVDLPHLVERVVRANSRDEQSVHFNGPAITIAVDRLPALAMALTELMINAQKHGALTSLKGRIYITWRHHEVNGQPLVILEWQETGGPTIRRQPKESLGLELVRGFIEFEMEGRCHLRFDRDGAHHKLIFPRIEGASLQ